MSGIAQIGTLSDIQPNCPPSNNYFKLFPTSTPCHLFISGNSLSLVMASQILFSSSLQDLPLSHVNLLLNCQAHSTSPEWILPFRYKPYPSCWSLVISYSVVSHWQSRASYKVALPKVCSTKDITCLIIFPFPVTSNLCFSILMWQRQRWDEKKNLIPGYGLFPVELLHSITPSVPFPAQGYREWSTLSPLYLLPSLVLNAPYHCPQCH